MRVHKPRSTILAIVLGLMLLFPTSVVVAAQTSTPAATPSSTSGRASDETLAFARERATTDAHLAVLEDDFVSDDEFRDSLSAVLICLQNASGAKWNATASRTLPSGTGLGFVSEPRRIFATPGATPDMSEMAPPKTSEEQAKCFAASNFDPLSMVYQEQQPEWDQATSYDAIVACFENSGVTEPGEMTADDLKADFENSDPESVDINDTNTAVCLTYPYYRGGEIKTHT